MNKTSKQIRIFVLSGLVLLSAACTTIKPVYDIDEGSFASQIKPGDRVRLTYLNSLVDEIRVTEVNETELQGTIHKNARRHPKGAKIVADWDDIHAIEIVKISAIKTAGAAVGVIVAIPFLALGLVLAGAGS